MLGLVSRLRHGPLRRIAPWPVAGRLYRILQRQTGFPRWVSKQIGPYGPFRLDGRFAFSNFENWGTAHNAGFCACVELARGRTCVLDIGAHIGLVTLPMSSVVAPGGVVHAFEPAAANLGFLKDHLHWNQIANVTVMDALVGNTAMVSVPFFELDTDSGLNSTARPRASAFTESRRAQVTIDGYCSERGLSPQLIKIDVEGAEVSVLRGARQTVDRCRPAIVLSVHPRQIAETGHSMEELRSMIAEIGYQVATPAGAPADQLSSGEYILSKQSTTNA